MITAKEEADYYDLAEQDYELTRAALRQTPPSVTPSRLSPEKSAKLVRGKPAIVAISSLR